MNRSEQIRDQKSTIRNHVALVTGTLAEPAMRGVAGQIAAAGAVEPHVVVLNIQVAALMTAEWVARKLELPPDVAFDRVVLPGYVRGDLSAVSAKLGVPVEAGPYDLRDLPELLGGKARPTPDLSAHAVEILAEINDAARLSTHEILDMAENFRADGADVIDLGCDPLSGDDRPSWPGVGEVVRELIARGLRVSIDSFHPAEVEAATAAGASLVLSVNSKNAALARHWHGAEVVVIPDDPHTLAGLDAAVAALERDGVRYRIDPVLEPIGLGFAASLGRYLEVRKKRPGAAMMMGVGNLTELTDVDSAGVNAVLIGFCAEVGIGSVLTTRVVNWARSCVKEIDLARRLMHHAVAHRRPPKRVDDRLVTLRDPKLRPPSADELRQLAASLTDRNIRLFADPATGLLHAMNKDFHAADADPFVLFDRVAAAAELDPSHAFYLGYELAKAATAVTLHKNYTQDQALRWGHLTREEISHHERRKMK